MSDAEERAAVAERAARAGAAVASEGFRADLPVERKDGKTDVVTAADRDAQRRVVAVIRERYPDDPVVGEESLPDGDAADPETVPEEGPAWVVDPIDGTHNYVREVPLWASSVAAVVDGEPVAAANVLPPVDDVYVSGPSGVARNGEPIAVSGAADPETFVVVPSFWWGLDDREAFARATRAVVTRFGDLRRWGSAQAALSLLAAGGAEGIITDTSPNPWDTVAGVHMVRTAGGTVTDLAGERWRHDSRGLVASNGTRHDVVRAAARDIIDE